MKRKESILHSLPIPIKKNLDSEARLEDKVAHYRMAGASRVENFRSPDFYVLLLFEKCSGSHTIDRIEYKQRDLQLHVSFPGQLHSWDTGLDAIGQKLLIDKKLIELSPDILLFSDVSPVLDLTLNEFECLNYEFSAIGKIINSSDFLKKMICREIVNTRINIIMVLLSTLLENKERSGCERGRIPPVLRQFKELVDRQIRQFRLVETYASQLNVTPNYINMLCQRHMGISAKKFIMQKLLFTCKTLLKNPNLTIKEISYELGFMDLSSFSMFIKEKTGLNPRKLREVDDDKI